MAHPRITRGRSAPAERQHVLADGPAACPPAHLSGSYPQHFLQALPASAGGTVHTFQWDFASQLEAGSALSLDITVFVTVQGGLQTVVPGGNATQVALGIDPPQVSGVAPPWARWRASRWWSS